MTKHSSNHHHVLVKIAALIIILGGVVSTAEAYDVNGDGREGLAETIHSLQVVAGLVPSYSALVFVGDNENTPEENGAVLLDALADITDNSISKPYVIHIEPGIYNIQNTSLTMKPYVHIQGSGQEATVITSTVNDDSFPSISGTVVLTDHTGLRELTIRNISTANTGIALLVPSGVIQTLVIDVNAQALGTTTNNYAIHVMGVGSGGDIVLTLQDVNALSENATAINCALRNYYHSSLTLRGGTYVGRGGSSSAYGISQAADVTSLLTENIIAIAENGATNYGLTNGGDAVAFLTGGSFTARGGSRTRGIWNYNLGSKLLAEGIVVLAEGGSDENHGLVNTRSEAILNGGSFTADGGNDARAIYSETNGAELQAVGVTALAKNATSGNYGMYNEDSSFTKLQGGIYTGQGGNSGTGIYNNDAGTRLETNNVSALGRNGSISNKGMFNGSGAEAILYGGSYIGNGDNSATGISNYNGSTLEATNIIALGQGGGSYNSGLSNTGTNTTALLRGSSVVARGGTFRTRGVYTYGTDSSIKASDVTFLAEGGSKNYGINIESGTAEIVQSTLEGSDNSAYSNSSGSPVMNLSNTQLIGGPVFGTVTCTAVTRGTVFSASGCP